MGSFTAEDVPEQLREYAEDVLRQASRAPSDSLTRDEFLAVARPARRPAGNREYGPEIAPQIFARFDKDGDDVLTREEASNPSSLVNEYFDHWDKDQNGELTRQEIVESLTEEPAAIGAQRNRRERSGDE